MPKHQYIGKQSRDVDKKAKYFETIVSFNELVYHTKMENIKKPNYQGSLLDEKVEKMTEEYLENPLLLRFKNRIIIGCINKNWYIIDGQHRIEMATMLFKNHNIEDKLVFCWYECSDEEEMKKIFVSVNHDSIKNQFYVSTEDLKQIIKEEFTGKLKHHNNTTFSRKKTTIGRIKTVEEFVNELTEINFFDNFTSSQQAYNHIMSKNKEFYDINRYVVQLDNNETSFYADEKDKIKLGTIFSLKKNNFVEWLQDENNKPYHQTRKIKASISPYKKKVVWNKLFGEELTGICPISFCTNELKRGVKNGYQCGHIISEYNGGATEVFNMKPICSGCNQSMGYQNWSDWDKVR
jgi:hypothetical protein